MRLKELLLGGGICEGEEMMIEGAGISSNLFSVLFALNDDDVVLSGFCDWICFGILRLLLFRTS